MPYLISPNSVISYSCIGSSINYKNKEGVGAGMGVLPIKLMLKLENFNINTSCADLRSLLFTYYITPNRSNLPMCQMAALGYS